jgi:hypothetical protein
MTAMQFYLKIVDLPPILGPVTNNKDFPSYKFSDKFCSDDSLFPFEEIKVSLGIKNFPFYIFIHGCIEDFISKIHSS